MRGPDGALPLLNDAWEGPAEPAPTHARPSRSCARADTSCCATRTDQLIIDAGVRSPRAHLPPHAHADALSFVLWADGVPLLVDPGTLQLHRSRSRPHSAARPPTTRSRSTAPISASSGATSALRSCPGSCASTSTNATASSSLAARHDGYRRLDDPVEHERWFCWIPSDGLVVVDVLHSGQPHRVTSRLHLAPGVPAADASCLGPFELQALGAEEPAVVVPGRYAQYLGTQTASQIIQRGGTIAPGTHFGWALLRPGARVALEGRTLAVTRRSGAQLRIELR